MRLRSTGLLPSPPAQRRQEDAAHDRRRRPRRLQRHRRCSSSTARADASPVEATRAVLARIERLEPMLNAFCHLVPEEALAAARASEARWAQAAPRGALDGVPVSIKDLILVARHADPARLAHRRSGAAMGRGCTGDGAPARSRRGDPRQDHDARVRLQGRDQLAAHRHHAAIPWNPRGTPGGSSGGTAAAVAAGMGPLSVGTDGAGSVRIPAAFCGNFGLKPSFGRVPAYPLSPFGSVAHLGPHTMSVADAALMMNVLKQPDARDWTSLPPDGSDYTARPRRRHSRPAHRLVADARLRQASIPRWPPRSQAAVRELAGAGRARRARSTPASTTRWRSPPASGSPAPGRSGTA